MEEINFGDYVMAIGPTKTGFQEYGRIFKVYQINKEDDIYTNGQEYNYPRSSLKKVRVIEDNDRQPFNKLFKVTIRGLHGQHHVSWVVATDPNSAYQFVRKYLDDEKIGFTSDRELESIELIADSAKYPDCKTRLFI